ncbi:mechanosensitive ion channel family protein [Williamwhitmania taraxaci]|uniref:Small-conductance mechanosensitive channel n=1 Tax=Williamwhitmania taraxaci TaxID=1640674 RepID=A0A1G6QSJ2_9BACT|nr:mechanosensitive ion channel family protein [Williamwhitmania taraxaci]SDC95332.1 Small-conductance mechanosensitive channel [Williamwhitmania taraxaci]
MKNILAISGLVILMLIGTISWGQSDSLSLKNDSVNVVVLQAVNKKLAEIEKQRVADSVKKAELEIQLKSLQTTDNLQKEDLLQQIKKLSDREIGRIALKKARIDSLRKSATGYPVFGASGDTLLLVYSKIGSSSAKERAISITNKIKKLYNDDFLKVDSITVIKSENTFDIVYGDLIILSVSENDAIWYGKNIGDLASEFKGKIQDSIRITRADHSWLKQILRIGLVVLVVLIAWFIIWLIGKGYARLLLFIESKSDKWLKDLSYNDYTFLTAQQELQVVLFLVKIFRWFVYAMLLYIILPTIFSIFPFSRNWADALFHLIWSPFKGVLVAVWKYLPNLFSILVIYFVMKYVIRFVKYIFHEIEDGKLKLAGFHPDWAMPTYGIVRFLLYAFMFVLLFPYLPGSDSNIFKGVSVFIGIIFSFGSSSVITNMVAGIVITYMRPFVIGDRIKIGDTVGDVVEKTLLVTRIRTIKNEVVTIPNASVLSGNTTNYSTEALGSGLIVYTSVTIGYDVPWKDMHQALIDAALRTDMILKEPTPFVLQTSLEDFYVSYQINAYTRESSRQAMVYSNLHQHIQDVCNERGIEILSPHYRAARDGNMTTIPADYLAKEYQAPSFKVTLNKPDDK